MKRRKTLMKKIGMKKKNKAIEKLKKTVVFKEENSI